MGVHYYLTKGYNVEDYYRCKLTKILDDKMNSLEEIDLYTSLFQDEDDLKEYLYQNGLIDTLDEDLVIGNNKTVDKINKIKRLVPIYLKRLVYKKDLQLLGIEGNSYKEWAKEIMAFINERKDDESFMRYIMGTYLDKYESSDKKKKAPIYESGDVDFLYKYYRDKEHRKGNQREFNLVFNNFFLNELYKCNRVVDAISLDGKTLQAVTVYRKIDNSINEKGLHDMIINILDYFKTYKVENVLVSNKTVDVEDEEEREEEFFEERDFERPLKEYAENRLKKDEDGNLTNEADPLDLTNEEAVSKDNYASSFIFDQAKLLKKRDGME